MDQLRKLFIQKDDGTYEELAAIIADRDLRAFVKTPIKTAIQKYIETCTSKKCPKNRSSEKLYFGILLQFLLDKKLTHIDQVEREHIDQYESLLLSRMEPASVNRRMSPVKTMFTKCMEWKIIFDNPCFGKKILKEQKNPFKPWSPELVRKFLSLTDGTWKKIFTFLWMTGARPMEVKNLRWSDVDYEDQQLTFRCGKNANNSRKFDMTPELDEFLHSIKMNGPFVFSENSRQLNNDNLYQYCKHRMRKLGLHGYTVYGIRHGFATNLAKNGANAFELAQCMGHSSLDTTRRYVHVDKKSLIEKLKKANQF